MLRLQANADEASGEIRKTRDAGEQTEQERRAEEAGIAKDMGQDAVHKDLHSLGVAYGSLAIVLDASQIVHRRGAAEEGFGEHVGCSDCVLYGNVDAYSAYGGHSVGRVSNAEEAGGAPVLEAVDLHGKKLHFFPGVDLGGAPGEKRYDAFDALVESCDAVLLDLREGAFGDDVSDLKVVDAIDENDEPAVVDVAESVFGVGGFAGQAEP